MAARGGGDTSAIFACDNDSHHLCSPPGNTSSVKEVTPRRDTVQIQDDAKTQTPRRVQTTASVFLSLPASTPLNILFRFHQSVVDSVLPGSSHTMSPCLHRRRHIPSEAHEHHRRFVAFLFFSSPSLLRAGVNGGSERRGLFWSQRGSNDSCLLQ